MFDNRVLGTIFGPEEREMAEAWRKLVIGIFVVYKSNQM